MMNMLGFKWTVFIVFFSFLLSFSMLLVHQYIDEYPVEFETVNSHEDFVRDKLGNMKLIFCHPKRLMGVIEATLIILLYYNILLWFPYYFTSFGYA